MNVKEITAPKISVQETDKLNALSETIRGDKIDSTTATADEKLLQRLGGQREIETSTPQIHADDEVNSGKSIDFGSDCDRLCIKTKVDVGRCYHG